MTNASIGVIHSYPENPRVFKALIVAKYNGLNVSQNANFTMGTSNKSDEFLDKFPLGKVPAFESAEGPLFESNAIAYYIALSKPGTTLLGGTGKYEIALVQQYLSFADSELVPAVSGWLYPLMGYVPFHKASVQQAKDNLKRSLMALDKILLSRTFLVGESITLADITVVCTLLHAYKRVLAPEYRKDFANVTRWFLTCVNQPEFSSVIGEVALATKEEEYDAKKFNKTTSSPEKQQKASAAQKPAEKKEKTKEKTAAEIEDEIEAAEQEEKKLKNPLDLLPPSPFVMDEWKRFYSNNDTRPKAINWFWEKFDPIGYSMWRVDYKYNHELGLVFMSSNLIGGFYQRLEKARKFAFGSMIIFGEDRKNEIKGMFIFRGQEIPAEVREAADFESYDFTKVNPSDAKIKELWNDYIAWDGELEGKKFADGKIFK